MKKHTSHIKAFTILEVVVSLAIMSIIIAMVYTIYALLSKQLYDYSSETELVNNYNQLHTVFKRDIHNANKLLYVGETLSLLSSSDSIQYQKKEDKLIRFSSKTRDTFLVKVDQFKVFEEDFLLGNNIKRVKIHYTIFGEQIEAIYFKNYGMSDYINNTFFVDGN